MESRRCAYCGHGQSSRRGGLSAFATLVSWAREAGVELKLPESRYLHLPCLAPLREQLNEKRPPT